MRNGHPHAPFPDLHTLSTVVEDLLRPQLPADASLVGIERGINIQSEYHSHASEFVTCHIAPNHELTLFIKYGVADERKGGPAHEAEVYRHLLSPLPISSLTFYGTHQPRPSETWLVTDGLPGAWHAGSSTHQERSMPLAATWAGRFHALSQVEVPAQTPAFLRPYGGQDYCHWSRRAVEFDGDNPVSGARLRHIARQWEDKGIGLLLEQPPTVIHANYFADNILFFNDTIYPIDWETATVAAGEIDLACLTHGWHTELVSACEQAYQEARWPAGPPPGASEVLAAARVYVGFWLLGETPGRPEPDYRAWFTDLLFEAAVQLGLE